MSNNTYEVRVKVMNAPLLNLMRANGMNTASDLSKKTGVDQNSIGKMLNLKVGAFNSQGNAYAPVKVIADYFRVLPDCLFPEDNWKNY